jgi:hypothetical protein
LFNALRTGYKIVSSQALNRSWSVRSPSEKI